MAKIRYGFVSNSSSSSFILAVPKNMDINLENVLSMLWPNTNDYEKLEFGNEYYPSISAVAVACTVTEDLKEINTKNDKEKIKDALRGYHEYDNKINTNIGKQPKLLDSVYKLNDEEFRNELNKYYVLCDVYYNKVYDKFLKQNPDCDIYTLEYSDNDGEYNSTMEHGGVFDCMIAEGKALKISHH